MFGCGLELWHEIDENESDAHVSPLLIDCLSSKQISHTSISLSILKTSFSILGFPLLVFSPSGPSSSPLVFAVGWTGLKLSKRQVEQVQHSSPPSLSRTFPTPHAPCRERERERKTHTERQRGRKTETQWETKERCWLLVFFKMIHLTWQNIPSGYNLPAHKTSKLQL